MPKKLSPIQEVEFQRLKLELEFENLMISKYNSALRSIEAERDQHTRAADKLARKIRQLELEGARQYEDSLSTR